MNKLNNVVNIALTIYRCNRMTKMNINVIDFFCGCGGTSAGLRKAGMNVIAGIDIDPQAIKNLSV